MTGPTDDSRPPDAIEPRPLLEVARDPRYLGLVRERSRFGWALSAIMLVVFFGYILLIAFAPEVLARRIGDGVTTVGIPVGIAVILCGILLTAVYVARANRRYDRITRDIIERPAP